jgi:hypothetical protein
MICIPVSATPRRQIALSSVDFSAREEVISQLEADYDASLGQLDELNARLESCLAFLTGKPLAQAANSNAVAEPAHSFREAA